MPVAFRLPKPLVVVLARRHFSLVTAILIRGVSTGLAAAAGALLPTVSTAGVVVPAPPAPVITSATTATGTRGIVFNYQIVAANAPTRFSATGLPAGVSVNTATGLISGAPTLTGVFPIALGATNAGGTGTAVLNLTINATGQAPAITTQPTARRVNPGDATTFSVVASGTAPIAYKWCKNGAPISGATSASYLIDPVSAGDAATYSVVVSNPFGTVASAGAALAVNLAPSITTQPVSLAVTVGQGAKFAVVATGNPSPTYQWRKNGVVVATGSASYTIPSVALGHAGSYAVVVTNAVGSVTSDNATLTVNPVPAPVVTSPLSATGRLGDVFNYQITATHGPTRFDATNLPAGLSVDTTTGLISGTPSAVGTAAVALGAANAGGTGVATLELTIAPPPNLPPVVLLTAPAPYSVFDLTAIVALQAIAGDPDGTVSKVEFFNGATKLAETSNPPYHFDWTPTSPGSAILMARATDNLGAFTDSAPIGIQLRPTLPYLADFEAAEGYTLGSLDNQLGWTVTAGSAQIVATGAAHGTQSVVLSPGAAAARVEQEFGPSATNPDVIYVDFLSKPVAGVDAAAGTLYDTAAAQVALVQNGAPGQFAVLNGNGAGTGTWSNVTSAVALDANHVAATWQRLTLRIDFTAKTWDFYLNGQLLVTGLGFRQAASSYLSLFALQGNASASTAFDDFYVGATNPLFADVNNDGIDDAWETAHGLSLATDNRNADTDHDGLSDLHEYTLGTNPIQSDTDSDGITDGWEVDHTLSPIDPADAGLPSTKPGFTYLLEFQLGTNPAVGLSANNAGLVSLKVFSPLEQ
jgi:hypothetical protein